MPGENTYCFGPFALDMTRRVLMRSGMPQRLTPREIDVLAVLVERHGEIVEKGQLFELVWQGADVDECNLAQQIALLRRVLGDDAREPTYIETVPRRGYRFVAPVSLEVEAGAPVPPPPLASPTEAPPSRRWLTRRRVTVALVALLAPLAIWGIVWSLGPSTRGMGSIEVQQFANLTGDAQHDEVADQLSSELSKDLAGLTGLKVEHRDRSTNAEAGGGPADGVVEGALLNSGGRVLLAAGLIDRRTNTLVWAETFESDGGSFVKVEHKIARCITSRLLGLPEDEEEEE